MGGGGRAAIMRLPIATGTPARTLNARSPRRPCGSRCRRNVNCCGRVVRLASARAKRRERASGVCQPLRGVPRHGRRRRRARPVDRRAHSAAQRRGARSGDSRGPAGRRHAGVSESVEDRERAISIAFLRTLRPRAGTGPQRTTVTLATADRWPASSSIRAPARCSCSATIARVHLLRETTAGRYREVTSQTGWTTYNGQASGNRYSALDADHAGQRLAARAAVGVHAAERGAAAGDAGGRRTA